MIKILIIGKKSFLGSNLTKYLENFYNVDNFTYEQIVLKNIIFFNQYTHVINTAIHPKYIKKRYNEKFDLDKKFINKFKKFNFYYIFFNTRKIYLPKENINERSILSPIDNYAKNKLLTEKFLKKNLKSKLTSLRISNIIGNRIFTDVRSNHKLFFDNFLKFKNYKKKVILKNDFKDFLSIDQFCKIISNIIKFNIYGTYNVSISKKIYLSEIIGWLNKNTLKKIDFIEPSNQSFTLSNNKLKKKIKIKLTKNQLKLYCQKLI